VTNFERLRQRVHDEGLMRSRPSYYVQKVFEVTTLLALAFFLQYRAFYIASACLLALCWQQLGWSVKNQKKIIIVEIIIDQILYKYKNFLF
jgi:hypothetical protein